jgi:hypothetical protein
MGSCEIIKSFIVEVLHTIAFEFSKYVRLDLDLV